MFPVNVRFPRPLQVLFFPRCILESFLVQRFETQLRPVERASREVLNNAQKQLSQRAEQAHDCRAIEHLAFLGSSKTSNRIPDLRFPNDTASKEAKFYGLAKH